MSSMTKKNNESSILVTSREAVTYIIVDTMLKQLKHKGEMNVVTYCRHIQQQCKHLVLTEEQYIFVHDVLSEAVASGETNIHRLQISQYISSLQNSFITDEHCVPWQLLDRQFKLATTQPLQESQYMSALRPSNHMKNQSLDFLPIEETRVVLQNSAGMEGSDYINASWVPGYNRARQFIISQHPAEQTCWDFWNMIWQTNTSVIICLSVFQHPFGVFWPHQNVSISMGNLRLSLTSEGMTAGYQSKTLSLFCEKEGRSSVVQLILCPNWPHKSVPVSNCVHLVDSVTKLCRDTGPMVVLDQFGATEAGIFCLVANLVKQVDCESHADVYYWFKTVNHHRPGIWVSPDNMLFVYRVMDELCSVKNVTDNHASKYGPLEI